MATREKTAEGLMLFISRSYITTEANRTGSWRFLKPRYVEKTSPCSAACPAGEDIARVEMLTHQAQFKEAWETILWENPFPGVCGRVCFHPCEGRCNRLEHDEAVAIHRIERFVADTAKRNGFRREGRVPPARPERIAVVGAGPAGLSFAYFMARLGYGCHVFESSPEAGGVLRWGIPLYRLPEEALRHDISHIEEAGVTIETNRRVDADIVTSSSYDAVFLGCGHARSRRIGCEGEDAADVIAGIEFLGRIRRGERPSVPGVSLVIGGGNTAVDVARSVVRLGGEAVIVYRRRREDMPAFAAEIDAADEEGIAIRTLLAPASIQRDGTGCRMTVRRMAVVGVDEDGRGRIAPEGEQYEEIEADRIFSAIGEEASEDWHRPPADGTGVRRFSQSVMAVPKSGPVVFYGGDVTTETKSVVYAVASGKEAAIAADVYFRAGAGAIEGTLSRCRVGDGQSLSMEIYCEGPRSERNPHVVMSDEINTDYFDLAPRITQPRLMRDERVQGFDEIDLRLSATMAMQEAGRCFNCGICNQCDNCFLFCPDLAVVRDETNPQGRYINYDYCKGCGLCVVECPRNAMVLIEESDEVLCEEPEDE